MRFLFRLDLILHVGAEFFFEILNFATKQEAILFFYPKLSSPMYTPQLTNNSDMFISGQKD